MSIKRDDLNLGGKVSIPSAHPIEIGWLVERRDRKEIEYLTATLGMWEWTTDSIKATRFCRREDADGVGSIFDEDFHIYIVEHQWG